MFNSRLLHNRQKVTAKVEVGHTKTKGAFTSDNALFKLIFAAIMHIEKKWTQPIHNWAIHISQLDIFFPIC